MIDSQDLDVDFMSLLSPRLKDLPISREDLCKDDSEGQEISSQYKRELSKVRSSKGLRAFVLRWRALWVLERVHSGVEPKLDIDLLLWRGRFSAKKVWRTLRKMNPRYKTFRGSRHWMIAADIKIPTPLIRGLVVSGHYGVPEDVALIQLYQGFEFF